MAAKLFPEVPYAPLTPDMPGKFLTNDGRALIWDNPYPNNSVIREFSPVLSTFTLTNIPRCNTYIITFRYSGTTSTPSIWFNNSQNRDYWYYWTATNGSGSTSNSGSVTRDTILVLPTPFSVSATYYVVKISGAATNQPFKTVETFWQEGSGNGFGTGIWYDSDPISTINFSFNANSPEVKVIGY